MGSILDRLKALAKDDEGPSDEGDEEETSSGSAVSDEEKLELAGELLSALKSGNKKDIYEAFEAMAEACQATAGEDEGGLGTDDEDEEKSEVVRVY